MLRLHFYVCHRGICFDLWKACLLEDHNERGYYLNLGYMKPEAAEIILQGLSLLEFEASQGYIELHPNCNARTRLLPEIQPFRFITAAHPEGIGYFNGETILKPCRSHTGTSTLMGPMIFPET